MFATEYRDLYFAISKGIDTGVSAESVLEELISEKKKQTISDEDYETLLQFFRSCDEKTGTDTVSKFVKVRN